MPRFVVPGDFLPPRHLRPDGDPGTGGRRSLHPGALPGRERRGGRTRGPAARSGDAVTALELALGAQAAVPSWGACAALPAAGRPCGGEAFSVEKEEVSGGLTCLLIIFFFLVPFFFFLTSRILPGGAGRRMKELDRSLLTRNSGSLRSWRFVLKTIRADCCQPDPHCDIPPPMLAASQASFQEK